MMLMFRQMPNCQQSPAKSEQPKATVSGPRWLLSVKGERQRTCSCESVRRVWTRFAKLRQRYVRSPKGTRVSAVTDRRHKPCEGPLIKLVVVNFTEDSRWNR